MVTIYADLADIGQLERLADDPRIKGFTTNPSLMRKSGITDYRTFARQVLALAKGKPVSFEVLSDDFVEMERQAREIASWGESVFVKIPVSNIGGQFSTGVIEHLADIRLNITAVFTMSQIDAVFSALAKQPRSASIVSIFAGRIADTGRDPMPIIQYAAQHKPNGVKVLWASAREVLNVYQAEQANVDIITLAPELISKLSLHGKSLLEYSLDTVKMFHDDGRGLAL